MRNQIEGSKRDQHQGRGLLSSSNPWASLMNLQKDMNQLFSELDFPWTQNRERSFDFVPSCEANETDKEIIVKFDVPGIKREDIKVEVQNNRLSITGERHEEKTEKKGKSSFSEVYYGSFARSFTLPSTVIADKVVADCKDGVLTVHLPKSEAPKAKQVEVR